MEMIEFYVLASIAIYHASLTLVGKVSKILKKDILDEGSVFYKISDFMEKVVDFFNGNDKHND